MLISILIALCGLYIWELLSDDLCNSSFLRHIVVLSYYIAEDRSGTSEILSHVCLSRIG